MIYLRPYTELGIVVEALYLYKGGRESAAMATAMDVWDTYPPIEVSENLTPTDFIAFTPMLHELEEPVGVPFSDEELWYLHGVMDWYAGFVQKGCWLTQCVLNEVTLGVAQLQSPPY